MGSSQAAACVVCCGGMRCHVHLLRAGGAPASTVVCACRHVTLGWLVQLWSPDRNNIPCKRTTHTVWHTYVVSRDSNNLISAMCGV